MQGELILAHNVSQIFEDFTHRFAKWAGSGMGFLAAFFSLLAWFAVGRSYDFSTEWENALTIYIGVITFLMIFLMQRAMNKELAVLHLKLNELIAGSAHADNEIINAEELTEEEISDVQETHREIGKQK